MDSKREYRILFQNQDTGMRWSDIVTAESAWAALNECDTTAGLDKKVPRIVKVVLTRELLEFAWAGGTWRRVG